MKSSIKCPIDSFKSQKPTLSTIAQNDDDLLLATLTVLINDVSNFLNVGKNFTVPQIEQTCYLIAQNFKHLKVDDILICFNRAKSGFYGKSYDRLDGMIVLEWLNAYESERDEQIVILRQNENQRFKKNLDDTEMNPKAVPMPQEVKDFFNKIAKKKEILKTKNLSESDILQKKIIARYELQFSNLFKKYGITVQGYRFLKINNLKMNLQEFMEIKLTQLPIFTLHKNETKNR